jgi:hypothetical protein
MKFFRAVVASVALIPALAAGCNKTGTQGEAPATGGTPVAQHKPAPAPSYKVVRISGGTATRTVADVQVSQGSSNALLAKWSQEVAKSIKDKKNLQINFYDGKPDKNTLIARFENGRLFDPQRPGRVLVPKGK